MTTLSTPNPAPAGTTAKKLLIGCLTALAAATLLITLIWMSVNQGAMAYLAAPTLFPLILGPVALLMFVDIYRKGLKEGVDVGWRTLLGVTLAVMVVSGSVAGVLNAAQRTNRQLTAVLGTLPPRLRYDARTPGGTFSGVISAHGFTCGTLITLGLGPGRPAITAPAFIMVDPVVQGQLQRSAAATRPTDDAAPQATPAGQRVTVLSADPRFTAVLATIPAGQRRGLWAAQACPGSTYNSPGSVLLYASGR